MLGSGGKARRRLVAPAPSRRAPRVLQCHRRGPAMKQDGAARRRGEKAKAPPDGPPPAPPDVEMQEETAAVTAAVPAGEAGGERQPQRELDAITLEGERRPGGGGRVGSALRGWGGNC